MRSGTTARAFVLDRVVPPLKGLNKYIDYYYPGLAPWAVQEYRPYRACALGCAGVSPLQGSSTFSPPISYFVVLMRLSWGEQVFKKKEIL